MGNDLVVPQRAGEVWRRPFDPATFLTRWQEGRSKNTLAAYASAFAAFTKWLDAHTGFGGTAPLTEGEAVLKLFEMHPGEANEIARAYRGQLLDQHLAPATVNLRLAALRSVVTMGRQFGYIVWDLELPDVKSQKYRDTAGPAPQDVNRIIEHVSKQERASTSARDVAIVMLMFTNGLRVSELTGLDLKDVDLRASRVQIMGKGRREPEWVTIAVQTLRVIKTWIRHRGTEPGPLFQPIDRHGKLAGERITRQGIGKNMRVWGDALELVLRPHGLRHSAVTAVLDATNGDIRRARQFARHGSVEVTVKYDDNRTDGAGVSAKLLAERVAAVVDGLEAREDA